MASHLAQYQVSESADSERPRAVVGERGAGVDLFGELRHVVPRVTEAGSLRSPIFGAHGPTMRHLLSRLFSRRRPRAWRVVAAEVVHAEAKLLVDDGYVALTDQGAAFSDGSGVDDTLSQLVHGDIDPNRQIKYVSAVESTIAGQAGSWNGAGA
jgi:hypothetical protein